MAIRGELLGTPIPELVLNFTTFPYAYRGPTSLGHQRRKSAAIRVIGG